MRIDKVDPDRIGICSGPLCQVAAKYIFVRRDRLRTTILYCSAGACEDHAHQARQIFDIVAIKTYDPEEDTVAWLEEVGKRDYAQSRGEEVPETSEVPGSDLGT